MPRHRLEKPMLRATGVYLAGPRALRQAAAVRPGWWDSNRSSSCRRAAATRSTFNGRDRPPSGRRPASNKPAFIRSNRPPSHGGPQGTRQPWLRHANGLAAIRPACKCADRRPNDRRPQVAGRRRRAHRWRPEYIVGQRLNRYWRHLPGASRRHLDNQLREYFGEEGSAHQARKTRERRCEPCAQPQFSEPSPLEGCDEPTPACASLGRKRV